MNQATALDLLKSGKNVFLTGQAGAGKTYVLNQYIDYLKARRIAVAVTASTGIAATHMNGMTIHTWAGIGIRNQLDNSALKRLGERPYLKKALDNVNVLIIDEISMLHANQFNLVNQVLKYFKQNDEAFGGIQVVVSGDFFQLPPVGASGERNRDKFAFMSQSWVDAGFTVCYLHEQFRQTLPGHQNDTQSALSEYSKAITLHDILNQIRAAKVTDDAYDALKSTKQNDLLDDETTRLFTHNADVDAINQNHLNQLSGKATNYVASTEGNEKLIATLKKSVRAPENLALKIGAKVMFVKNDFEQGFFNGTLATVVGFYDDDDLGRLPEVQLRDHSRCVVTPATWSVDSDSGKSVATYTQLPLCYAWAITVHKSQGMTLEEAEIDLSQTFEAGQGYVALSRLKSLSGLRLLGFNEKSLTLDALAMKADRRFQELSAAAERDWFTLPKKTQSQLHQSFIVNHGGTTNQYIIDQYHKVTAAKFGHYASETLAKTHELLQQSLTIAEIASTRELAESTVVNHIARLLSDQPDLPVGHIKPDDELIANVQDAYDVIVNRNRPDDVNDDGSIKLRAVFTQLNEQVGYNQIRLAMLFIKKTQVNHDHK